jgi:predicted deacetylase
MPKQQQLSSSSIVSFLLFVVLCCCSSWSIQVHAFVSPQYPSSSSSQQQQQQVFDFRVSAESGTGETDPKEIIARRIIVEGDVEGGYYRSCVRNEVGTQHKITTQRRKIRERERGKKKH